MDINTEKIVISCAVDTQISDGVVDGGGDVYWPGSVPAAFRIAAAVSSAMP